MAVPQLVLDAIRFLLALAAPAALVALVLAGIALRREGTTSFSVGGGDVITWVLVARVAVEWGSGAGMIPCRAVAGITIRPRR